MADKLFKLKVFSGRGLEIELEVQSVHLESAVGQLGFYADHREYIGLLATGVLEAVSANDALVRCVPAGGVCTFRDNVLTLLADTVDLPESVDPAVLKQDCSLLTVELEGLTLYDPEWEVVSQKLARISAVEALIAA
jgi:F0F1-type ATP synthase epsilon subunit